MSALSGISMDAEPIQAYPKKRLCLEQEQKGASLPVGKGDV